jgi:hypothetical protein
VLSLSDFYLWGMLQEKVYMKNPHSVKEVQANIMHKISTIPVQQN